MILRRLTQNLKKQNWTAIWIEIVLLVAGVFLGIQVSNWNEERVARAQERSDLMQLRAEIVANRRMLEYQVRYVGRVVAGGRNGLQFLKEGKDCVEKCGRCWWTSTTPRRFGGPVTRLRSSRNPSASASLRTPRLHSR
ncbi:MAG TPA: hypothetical protein VFN25_05300 [Dokdonella sp.]|uniref:hypothetical protein n=1 Tax=Dokdonella sp. TaxID=2291710 RepID=UPI002D7FA9A4|nr:hypothetical protein [Dokdonella sp.]HET9032306.1 hypothetical protein [Dokdonella sp.]